MKQGIAGGATGGKVPVLDLSAAPLGTDDEAAGAPPTRKKVAARAAERRATARGPERRPTDRGEDRHGLRLLGALAALGVAALWFSHA